MTVQPLVVGNWKMNGLKESVAEAVALDAALRAAPSRARVGLCPPATLLGLLSQTLEGSVVVTGGQDCHHEASGAYTGDVAAEMIHDAGGRFVILGHSERRSIHREDDDIVAAKTRAALRAGLEPIVCVGEDLDQRKSGQTLGVVLGQVRNSLPGELAGNAFAVAYEPVWAIGTGLTPTLEQIEEVHRAIRATLLDMFGAQGGSPPILYGGSVKPSNAAEILAVPEVNGALVGGASLKAADFLKIIEGAG